MANASSKQLAQPSTIAALEAGGNIRTMCSTRRQRTRNILSATKGIAGFYLYCM